MAIIDISVVPVGTSTPSVSRFVAGAVRILQSEPGIKYEVTDINTFIDVNLELLLAVDKNMHDSTFNSGIQRVVTTLRIDERRDKPLTMTGKVDAVKKQLD